MLESLKIEVAFLLPWVDMFVESLQIDTVMHDFYFMWSELMEDLPTGLGIGKDHI